MSAPGVIPRPGFQNRRNRSGYLKRLFPAGFGVDRARDEMLVDHPLHHSVDIGGTHAPMGVSFVGWGRAVEDSSTIASLDGTLDDPHANCAGPTMRELAAMRTSISVQSSLPHGHDPSCSVSRCRIHSSKPPRQPDGVKDRVFHAPACLPTLHPSLQGAKASSSYDKWLRGKRMKADDAAWLAKGNGSNVNYSAHSFGGRARQLVGAGLSPLSVALPAQLHVEIHTSNQVLHARSTSEHSAHYSYKVLAGDVSLANLKTRIVQDIVRSIQQAFAADALADAGSVQSAQSSTIGEAFPHELSQFSTARSFDSVAMNSLLSTSSRIAVSMNQIELLLHFYHTALQAWRPLEQEQDWVQAKHVYAQRLLMPAQQSLHEEDGSSAAPVLQVMYALQPKSEQQLLKEIESHYELRQQQVSQVKEHISIQALTDALQSSPSRSSSSLLPTGKPSLSRSSTSSKPVALLSAGPSILYPKPSAKLQSLADEGRQAQSKMQTLAVRLEQQILKTKW